MQNSRNTLRALMFGSAIGLSNALGSALGGMRSIIAAPQVQTATAGSGKGESKGVNRQRSFWYRPTRTSSQKTRNPADPAQAYLIARAEAKRARRAEKLERDASQNWLQNDAHDARLSLDPLYVNQ